MKIEKALIPWKKKVIKSLPILGRRKLMAETVAKFFVVLVAVPIVFLGGIDWLRQIFPKKRKEKEQPIINDMVLEEVRLRKEALEERLATEEDPIERQQLEEILKNWDGMRAAEQASGRIWRGSLDWLKEQGVSPELLWGFPNHAYFDPRKKLKLGWKLYKLSFKSKEPEKKLIFDHKEIRKINYTLEKQHDGEIVSRVFHEGAKDYVFYEVLLLSDKFPELTDLQETGYFILHSTCQIYPL